MTDKNEYPVFVYGSLKRGFHNNGILLTGGADFLTEAVTKYMNFLMFSLGSYPGVITTRSSVGYRIGGEIWMVNQKTLGRLDLLEGNGFMYRRELVVTLTDKRDDSGMNHLAAWMYLWMDDSGGLDPRLADDGGRVKIGEGGVARWF